MKQITTSERQTFTFAKNYAKQLRGGEVIGLVGELGAGKTVFTKGLAVGLGIKKNIASPTFVLMKIYLINPAVSHQMPGVKYLVHIDAYRIKSPQDLIAIGAGEYFNRPDAIVVIEWADKIKKILPKKTKYVIINNKEGNNRIIYDEYSRRKITQTFRMGSR